MAREKSVNVLVSALVAVAFLIFVFLSGMAFNFGVWNYLFLVLVAAVVYLLFLYVYSRSIKPRVKSEFRDFGGEPIVEYKSPAMEEFDREYQEAKVNKDVAEKLEVVDEGFVGTEESKMYHKTSCRFAKLIKPKYRVEADKEFFKKKKFKPCSVCKPNKK